jgi:hypothetical protein
LERFGRPGERLSRLGDFYLWGQFRRFGAARGLN